jgi:hypothetical protein
MNRLSIILVLGAVTLAFSPATAAAQFGPGPRFNGPVFVPPVNPFFFVPQYRYQYGSQLNFQAAGANFSLGSSRFYQGVAPPAFYAPVYPSFYAQGGSYMSGSAGPRPNFALQAQRDLANAQKAMGAPNLAGAGGPGVEKPAAAVGKIEVGPMPDGFGKALAPADRARVLSGESLNELLAEIVKAEPKGGNRPSAFVPALLLDEVRFGGSDAADALNLSRRAGNLDFPAAFDDAALKDLRVALDKDFAAVAAAVQNGKAPDADKRAQLEVTLGRVETALAPVVKNLPAEDATAARRFMDRMTNAVKAFKAGAATGLIDPKWEAEGTTVADLVKHMTRHKLQFAEAPAGHEDSYTTMHRNLATYLFVLTQPKK